MQLGQSTTFVFVSLFLLSPFSYTQFFSFSLFLSFHVPTAKREEEEDDDDLEILIMSQTPPATTNTTTHPDSDTNNNNNNKSCFGVGVGVGVGVGPTATSSRGENYYYSSGSRNHHHHNNNNNIYVKLEASSTALMDLDFGDLDASWSFDEISGGGGGAAATITAAPVLISNSDQPCSPLWAFSDAPHFPNSFCFEPCHPDPISHTATDHLHDDDDDDHHNNNKIPPPFTPLSPPHNLDVSFLIKERMTRALRYFKELTDQHQILAQVWAPVRSGNRYVLTTSGQPFVLGPHSNGLNQYRTVSLMYMFAVDVESDVTLGLPGRVFNQKLPEWTPNVQYYSSKEYPRVDHAKHYNVKGTLALPVFEPSGHSCVGVLELIMTSQKINYAPEVDKVCKALEAVNLRSSEILDHPNIQICNEGRQNALAEILEVLTEVCETYKLPLAQTWIPCRHRSVLAYGGGLKKSCSSFDGSCMGRVCMSTTDVAYYVVDAQILGFREACAEHHLQRGQGVAGRAFSSHGLSFCRDISQFCKFDYPLVHYARMFRFRGSFAICLRSKHTGDDDYVLEFFLPSSITDSAGQLDLLDSILATMKEDLQNLMVASGNTLEEERKHMEIIEVSMDYNHDAQIESNLSIIPTSMAMAMNGAISLAKDSQKQLTAEASAMNIVASRSHNPISPTGKKEAKKTSERKRGKAEKQISLEVLQQYFAGSLKDAAKSLGVCPTTMKRICRQHGISRWPSRKINKVNRSLTKLKRVIESVQGADGTFSLTSLAQPTMPVPVGSISWPAGVNGTCHQLSPTSQPTDVPDERSEMPSYEPRTNGQTCGRASSREDRVNEQNGFTSKGGSGSTGTSTSHGSCHGSPGTESNPPPNGNFVQSFCEQVGNSSGLMFRQNGAYSIPDALFVAHSQDTFGGMLLEDAGSSKDLRNICSPGVEANADESPAPEAGWINPSCPSPSSRVGTSVFGMTSRFSVRQDMKTVTIKATFREDIIRFRFSLASNIVELREEVSKRLKLEVGTFEIKYLDDDHEWVLIACDSDLQECLDVSRSSGSDMIRLLIQDIMGNLGSSCESSGE